MDRTLPLRRFRSALISLTLAAAAGGCGNEAPPQGADLLVYDQFVGSYYGDQTIEEASAAGVVPDLMRLDTNIDFPALRADFGHELGVSHYSVRWEGYVYADGVRGVVVAGLGRAGLIVDGVVVFRPAAQGGLIDERRPLELSKGWHPIELWYENLDANTHALRFGWMSPNSDLVTISDGFRGVGRRHLPDAPINLRCEAEPLRFQSGRVTVEADTLATLHVTSGLNDLTSDVPRSNMQSELLQLDPGTDVTVNVSATTLDGQTASASCTFRTEELPHWVEGYWRAEYYEYGDQETFGEAQGVRFEPAPPTYPNDLPFASERTEWFPGTGSNTFAVRWTAWLRVDAAATYDFSLLSDDGSRLFVDDEEVLNLWDDYGENDQVEMALTPGYHLVVAEYYQTYGASYVDWQIQEVGGDGVPHEIDPTHLTGEILEEPEDAPAIVTAVQHPLDTDDDSYQQYVDAGCVEALDLHLNQPAGLEVEANDQVMLLSRSAPSTVHRLCVLGGTDLIARVRLSDLDNAQTDWLRVEFTRPAPDGGGDGM